MNYIEFFKKLKSEDWSKKVSDKWSIKDVLSHLVGWEREVAIELRKTFDKGEEPWFMETNNYSDFNNKIYEEFKDYSPGDLIMEFEKWTEVLDKEIREIGEEKIRQKEHTNWIFDEGDEPHFEHHINQTKKVL